MYACAHTHIRKDVPNKHKRDILYPVGHLSLLNPEIPETCDISKGQNKALINAFLICLQNPSPMRRHPFVRFCAAKVLHFFELRKNSTYKNCHLCSKTQMANSLPTRQLSSSPRNFVLIRDNFLQHLGSI